MLRAALTALPLLLAVSVPAIAQDATADVTAAYATFAERLNADDIDGILAMFSDDAVFVPAPGQPVTGKDNIGAAMGQFAQISDNFTAKVRSVIQGGDTALALVDWQLTGKNADGSELTLSGTTTDVLVRGDDGTWLFVIDNPFGTVAAN